MMDQIDHKPNRAQILWESTKTNLHHLTPNHLFKTAMFSVFTVGATTIALQTLEIRDLKDRMNSQETQVKELKSFVTELAQEQSYISGLFAKTSSSFIASETANDERTQELSRNLELAKIDKNDLKNSLQGLKNQTRDNTCMVLILIDNYPRKEFFIEPQTLQNCYRKQDRFSEFVRQLMEKNKTNVTNLSR
ncbi:MAG: hypothetical protein ACD_30C00018G0006 [uncultured bacterium]|nr:MAG: hypothetical protein ACD_30C00018G0006 [uncultured bacterium]KKQ08392.1 MAG: hypothetical protein US19_C0025G0006 [Candidatus Daviesbacteria bacterium GW2011_GWB1_36_5]OGE17537.1 MAG: hypothetical protein A2858_01390 [Candidatus Daviesbacteria bacterium RIFCSPHIGHO2_01_FULL_36_37]OGE36631.1 MAG: hypothetical protein A3E66_03235 [Candidatus Daviesbacteria bacterium RIFCSPHIGHO2_12_FULL_37_16]